MDVPRIEVELVSSDGAPAEPEPRPPGRERGFFDSERGRLTVAAVAAAVVAFAVGWVLGRSTAPEEASPSPTVEAAAAPESTTTGEALPAPDPDDEPTTTRVQPVVPTTATTAPTTSSPGPSADSVVAESVIELPAMLQGADGELVVTGGGRTLWTLDLAAAQLTELSVPRQPFGPPTLYAGDGWILLPSWDDTLESTLVADGGPVTNVDLGVAWALVPGSAPGTFWRLDPQVLAQAAGRARLVGFDGADLGAVTDLPPLAAPPVADPAGGLLVAVPGGTFQVGPDGATRVSSGEVLAASPSIAVAFECDDQLECGHVVIDRASGVRTPLAIDADLQLLRPWWSSGAELVSPDGSAMIVLRRGDGSAPQEVLGVLDLTTGRLAELAAIRDVVPAVWSPDGRFVFYVDGGRLFAFERASGDAVEISSELVGVGAIAVRSRG